MSLISKVKKFFDKPVKKQKQKTEKLEAMIKKLVAKAERLNKRYENEVREAKKEKLLKEYKAVKKVLRKSRQHLASLQEACEKE